jgi:uncharacterized membrane protein YcfT
LISGLFLARVIDRDWRTYLDKKVVHFAYFYVLWLTIQFAMKAPGVVEEAGLGAAARLFAVSFIDPFGTIWFIYLLPIFFVVTKAARGVRWWIVWLIGAALEMARIDTGWIVIDEFAARFTYFYSGYVFAQHIFRFADRVSANASTAGVGLMVWALANGLAVFGGVSEMPGISLGLGFFGATAVVAFSSLLAKGDRMAPIRYCGRNSIVIYLAFFLPMAATRAILIKLGIVSDTGTISLIVSVAAVIGPLVLHWIVRDTRARFLFERPVWAHLHPRRIPLVPANSRGGLEGPSPSR